jgi:hypothetical protein
MSGRVKAPRLTQAEVRARAKENARRRMRHQAVLDEPPRTVECPACLGLGYVTRVNTAR